MPDKPEVKAASNADSLIRELRALIERRGWVASGSGIDQEGGITVQARPKTDDDE